MKRVKSRSGEEGLNRLKQVIKNALTQSELVHSKYLSLAAFNAADAS
jgi:hypothetical protein